MTNLFPRNVWILTMAQACLMSSGPLVVFAGGILGAQLAPNESMSTLPVASLIVGTALSTVPVALIMKKLGRKLTFISLGVLSIFSCLMAAKFIEWQSFYGLCLSFALLGVGISSVQQFRFAAMESVDETLVAKAASTVLLGGIAAAFLGPEIAIYGQKMFETEFVGSMLLMSVLFGLGTLLLFFYSNTQHETSAHESGGRPLGVIIKQPVLWVAILSALIGYAVMSFIMTATPVSMHVMDGHAMHHTKWVIQSHIVAMFLPSLLTGYFISKLGVNRMIFIGVILYALCVGIALIGQGVVHYWISLVLLGIGWNFQFVGGTALLPSSYQPNERFKVQALNEFLVFGSQAIASLSAGYFVFTYGWQMIQWVSIPVLLIPLAAIIYLKAQNRTP